MKLNNFINLLFCSFMAAAQNPGKYNLVFKGVQK